MHVNDDQANVPGYVSIKEAAEMLGLSPSRVYEYVEDGRLSSVRAAHVILIPVEEVKKFKPNIAGRPRKSVLRWRISPENNMLHSTSIVVQMRAGRQTELMKRLEEMRQEDKHLFPGTIARFIMRSETIPGQVEISLIERFPFPFDVYNKTEICKLRDFFIVTLSSRKMNGTTGSHVNK